MRKRPGFKAMAIVADDDDAGGGDLLKSSLSVTAGGSLQVRLSGKCAVISDQI
jgi:hypothetical protein